MLRTPIVLLLLGSLGTGSPAADLRAQPKEMPTYVPERLELSAQDLPPDLVSVPVPPATREGLRLRRDAWNALNELFAAAREDGVHLRIVSAYRSFEYQAELYERAVRKHGAEQRWVAPAGSSEHQLGTAVDVADSALQHVLVTSFAQTREGRWLHRNAERFGFVLSYTHDNFPSTGIEPEPWHIRYLGGESGPE